MATRILHSTRYDIETLRTVTAISRATTHFERSNLSPPNAHVRVESGLYPSCLFLSTLSRRCVYVLLLTLVMVQVRAGDRLRRCDCAGKGERQSPAYPPTNICAKMLLTGLSGLMARRTLLLGITAWQAQSGLLPASAAQRGAEDAYAVSQQPSTNPATPNLGRHQTHPHLELKRTSTLC